MARPMPRAPPLTIMFLGGAWKAMVVRVGFVWDMGVWMVGIVVSAALWAEDAYAGAYV